jgi:L-seryl-tRNA(Ser) seleniumtransferase
MKAVEKNYRSLPGVDKLLADARIGAYAGVYPHETIVEVIREALAAARRAVGEGKSGADMESIIRSVTAKLESLDRPALRRVINAAGVIIHTNLGRAPLSEDAIRAMDEVSRGYSNLEFDLDTGERGSRHAHLEGLLCRITGAEAALAVNNNAAAVLLGLSALAKRKEVIISRGQAVEIGGGFRIPDVMRQSGAKLVEVGTTNRTYARDYEEAVTEKTAGLMRVHSSNFKLVGFTSEVTLEELASIARQHNLIFFDDLGSGCFLNTADFGLVAEPTVQQSVKAGVSLTFFSGDKLVGGPQAGIIVGKKEYIDTLKKHPLARAMRLDKTRIAALAATLTHYLKGEAAQKIPIWRMIAAPVAVMEKRAQKWAKACGGKVVAGETMVGGGSLPGAGLPTKLVVLPGGGKLALKLRQNEVPIIGRVEKDRLLLDPRTVLPEEDEMIIKALKELVVH